MQSYQSPVQPAPPGVGVKAAGKALERDPWLALRWLLRPALSHQMKQELPETASPSRQFLSLQGTVA